MIADQPTRDVCLQNRLREVRKMIAICEHIACTSMSAAPYALRRQESYRHEESILLAKIEIEEGRQ